MGRIQLTRDERVSLEETARHGTDARLIRRAQSLLWLDDGEAISVVARRQDVSRQTVHRWIRWLRVRGGPTRYRLEDEPRSGRPAHKRAVAMDVIRSAMQVDPRSLGYMAPVWTSALLREQVKREKGVVVSQDTVRRTLRDLGYRYKRPRHTLSRRSRTWRQAKGGSYAA